MKKKNNVTIWIICGVILVVLIAVIGVLIVNGTNTNKSNNIIENNTNNNTIVEPTIKVTEQDIINKYGVSKKDAEELALSNFNSDNYECQTETTENYTYMVTVTDIIDDSKYVFEVDPETKTAFLIEK